MELSEKSTIVVLTTAERLFEFLNKTIQRPTAEFSLANNKGGVMVATDFLIKAQLFVPLIAELIRRGIPLDSNVEALYNVLCEEL